MLKLGIDQINLVVSPDMDEIYEYGWPHNAEKIIDTIARKLDLNFLYGGGVRTNKKLIRGYTEGKAYGVDEKEIRMCYHPEFPGMGVVINFTAQALANYKEMYKEEFDEEIYEYEIIQCMDDAMLLMDYTIRLSRIDFFADYIDEGINVDTIYKQLERKNQIVQFLDGRLNPSSRSHHGENGNVDTLYIGKRGRNVRCLLRIYDKKKEQISKVGRSYREAIACESWVRAEAEFHTPYSGDITEELLKIHNPEELGKFIAKSILSKYGFYSTKTGNPTKQTRLLMDAANDCKFEFSLPSTRDIKLEKSHQYVREGSGVIKNAYLARRIWGDRVIYDFMDQFRNDVEKYEPTEEAIYWLRKHEDEYKKRDVNEVFGFEVSLG